LTKNGFRIAPALPDHFLNPGSSYGMTNLNFGATATNIEYKPLGGTKLRIKLSIRGGLKQAAVVDSSGAVLATSRSSGNRTGAEFDGENGAIYSVVITA
jgi:hypothetical protein